MSDYVKVTIIEPDGREYSSWTPRGKSVWEAMEMMGWDTGGACGGQGTCGKCKFRMSGGISAITPAEREHLIPEEIKNGQRLACRAIIEEDFTLFIDYWTDQTIPKHKLLRYRTEVPVNSPVTSKDFYITGRQQDVHIPVYDRVKQALSAYKLQLSIANINNLALLDRPGRPVLELHAVIINNQSVEYVGRQRQALYGLALDIGTTSLFAALVDMESGAVAAMASHTNMQRIYGDDIISRINYTIQNPQGTSILHQILINNVNSMIEEMLQKCGADPMNIYRITAVGNPAILHLFFGLNVGDLGRAPYTGIFAADVEILAVQLGMKVNPAAYLYILPQLGGFVGADTTACLLTLAAATDDSYLLLDIGTNGEIVLYHQGKMWATSAAAGPAFEGGAISCGMRAGQGAIDKVSVKEGALDFRVIGGGAPRGICGSGIVDLISVLLQYHGLDRYGKMQESPELQYHLRSGEHGPEIILFGEEHLSSGQALAFNQDDVRQLQLARSAIRTAVEILLDKAGLAPDQLHRIYLAGAFGSYMDPASILNIGLIPPVGHEKISNIGNAAAEGAIMALLNKDQAQEAAAIKARVEYVELAEQDQFQAMFIKNINFM